MNSSLFRFLTVAVASAWLVFAGVARAQVQTIQRPGGFGGTFPGGFGGGNASFNAGGGGGGSSANSSRQYLNSTMVGDAMITSDMDTRRLIVVTDEDTNENIRQIIANLDKPKPQVLINVIFVQVTHDKNLDLGTEITKYTNSNLTHSTLATVTSSFGHPETGAAIQITKNTLDATLHALAGVGKTEILSRPSILTRSSQQATILVGQSVPFITNSRISDTNGDTINTVQYQDIGIILRVTPFITSEGNVEMIVSPEISSLSATTVPISSTQNSPVIDKRSADTVVVTPSDQTVVIGGLISNQTNDQDSKVPILGDIPLIGYAFKRKVKSNERTELLIFMTPHVVQHPEDLAKISGEEEKKADLTTQSFEQKELDKYVGHH